MTPTSHAQGSPLSLQQTHLWSLQRREQDYRSVWALDLHGQWDWPRFYAACDEVMSRHEILRTLFARVPGMDLPLQVIGELPLWTYAQIVHDDLAPTQQEQTIQAHLATLCAETHDLEHGPLLLVQVLLLPDHAILLLSLPALCADPTSARLWLEAVLAAYGQQTPPDEVLHYADVAAWQEEHLLPPPTPPPPASSQVEAQRRLPFQRDRDASRETPGAPQTLAIPLPDSLVQQMRQQAIQQQSTLPAWLLTCWTVLLWRLSEETAVPMGVACDTRLYDDLAQALGPYTRYVPVEARCESERPFARVLASMTTALQDAEQNPFTLPTNDEAGFPVLFDCERWPASYDCAWGRVVPLIRWCWTEPFRLKLSVWQRGEQLHLDLSYDAQRMQSTQMPLLADLLRRLLEQVTHDPQVRLGAISLLPASHAMLHGPERTWAAHSLQQLVEAQANLRPGALAVISSQEQLTYAQLNARANQLARLLRRAGVGPGVLVGVLLARQATMLVGVLGILKAGGAYLPLDAASPAARLSAQLQQSTVGLVLTQEALRPSLSSWSGSVWSLEALAQDLREMAPHDLKIPLPPDTLAYVLYTSGSTGTPKGVMVAQSSVVNYTLAVCEHLGAAPGWQYATVSTLAADLGNTAIFCALASGGCVQVLDYETVTSGEAMARWAEQHPIDVLKIVPSHLAALLESEQAHVFLPRRALVLGGEALCEAVVARIEALGGTCQIYNHYGPTETTVGVLMQPVPGMREPEQPVPLGRPLANSRVAVLDRRMQPVPPGIMGDLYLGGAGLAWGYGGQGALTAERFVPDPFSEVAGERLYRTGDLVRSQPDGTLVFVGRADQQIKLRGYRIEPAEIEAALRQHPQVRESLVIVHQDARGEPHLVGYLLIEPQRTLTRAQIEASLRERVPQYMLPTHYVQLEQWPRTPNGKIDRQHLPSPDPEETHTRDGGPAQSPLEELVAQIWTEVLGTPIGRQDNFFAVGGHSLLATRVMARLRAALPVDLPVRTLFEAPTIAACAQVVQRALRQGDEHVLPPLVAGERPEVLPLSWAQQRLWFLAQLAPESTAYLACRALKLEGTLSVRVFEDCWQHLQQRHESLRTLFREQAGHPIQVVQPAGGIRIPVIDLHGLAPAQRDQEAQRLTRQETQQLCDLARGPLLRLALLREGPQEQTVLLTLHHIITDGWSMEILVQEFAALYQAGVQGSPSPLAPLLVQYADYALWQRQVLHGEALRTQAAYWSTQLAQAPALELPTDAPRHAGRSYQGGVLSLPIAQQVVQGVQTLSQQENVTLFMTLLAAFQVLVMRSTGQHDLSVSTPIANRTRTEIEGVVGFFVNTLVLRCDLSGNPSFMQVLRQVRERCLQAYAHQDIPFEQVVELLHPQRDGRGSALFPISFQMAHESDVTDLLPGLRMQSVGDDGASADYELRVMVTQSQQGLQLTAFYDRTLFEEATIRRLLEHFQTLLHGLVRRPEQPVGEVPLLTEQERERYLETWNATQEETGETGCVQQVFEQQVQATPDAVALVIDEQQMSYGELNRYANRLAHHLQGQGVGPEVLVGICLERSLEMVIGLLAILKAGGAYVPLDPSLPQERLEYMVNDAQVALVLTHTHLQLRVNTSGMKVIPVDVAHQTQKESNPGNNMHSDQIVYMIYTSGSTGKPKGVMNIHAGLMNRLTWMQRQYPLCKSDRVLQKTPFSFDVSVWEFFWPLITGARLVLARPGGHQDPTYLRELIQQEQITTLHFVPSMLQAFLLEPTNIQVCTSLRHVMCSGEALPASLQERVFAYASPSLALHNLYGPTEASIDVTYWDCLPEEQKPYVPIGRPIANTQIYILDRELQPTPPGVVGEVYIGGIGLARGYSKRSDLTAERFLPNPFSKSGGERLYWTGDIARYLPTGVIDFLGRVDDQVKLRGYRIELGEIEATLRHHPIVQEAVVVVREDQPGVSQLVAYVVPDLHSSSEFASPHEQASLTGERLQRWQELYDETYQQPAPDLPTFNTIGWNSSYTGQPIAAQEMQEWVDDTLMLVHSSQPQRIWEIGCGTGLLLFPLASTCQHYYGTDFSAVALTGIQQQLDVLKKDHRQSLAVTLLQRQADDFQDFPEEPIDTVVINSVIQYFPDLDYLLRVLDGAVRRVASGGRIIIGDVRSFPLLEAFSAAVQVAHAPETLTRQHLWQQVQQQVQQETELLVAPTFFWDWAHTSGRVSRVEIRLKRGHAHNELTQFRYQVVLHVGQPKATQSPQKIDELDGSAEGFTWEGVRQKLIHEQPAHLRLRRVSNARVEQAVHTVRWLKGEIGPETVGHWQRQLHQPQASGGIEPEEVWEGAEALGYHATISWRDHQEDGCYTVWLQRKGDGPLEADPEEEVGSQSEQNLQNWQRVANEPLWGEQRRRLVPQLRQYLQERLPEYMVPARLVLLSALPVTTSGKLDRRALPAPEGERWQESAGRDVPETPIEHLLADMWKEVLGLSQIGRQENFFELGGHSLLVTQLVARIRSLLQVEVPVRIVFETPTIAGLARWIEQAQGKRQEHDLPLQRAQGFRAEFPLSFAQQRLWFLDQLHPNSTQYLSAGLLRWRGPLNSRALQQSVQEIVARHESLRTTFVLHAEHPVQKIHAAIPVVVPTIDLRHLPQDQRTETARTLAIQERQQPYQLEVGPLFRLFVLLVGPQEQELVLSMHHIITDGWSNEIFLHELSVLYRAFLAHEPSPLAPLQVQYADYALWQRQRLQGKQLAAQVAYWQAQLQGAVPLELPSDAPRAAGQSHVGARYSFALTADLSAEIVAFSRREGVTLFMTLLAAFQVLLYRVSGHADIVVGTDVANRTHIEMEGLIGFFVNLLALRTKMQGAPDFLSIVHQVRTTVLGAYAHQELPFELVVEHVQAERKEQQTPIVQVLCVMQNVPRSIPDLPDSELEMIEEEDVAARFDLALFLQEEVDGIKGSVVYRTDLFKKQTIAAWMRQFGVLLRSSMAKPETLIDILETYSDEDKTRQAQENVAKRQVKGKRIRAAKSTGIEIPERTNRGEATS